MNGMHIYTVLTALAVLWAGANASPLVVCGNDTINMFVADDRSLCAFYQCDQGYAWKYACAKGSRVPSYFTKGPSNPCVVKLKKNTILLCNRCNVTDDPIPVANKSNQCALFRPCDARPGCTCIDQVEGYYCNCPPSATAVPIATAVPTPPQTPVQQCDVNVCKNNGTCYSLFKNKFCNCRPPYTGKFCDIDACTLLPCKRGTCEYDERLGVYCACDRCYTGPCCEDKIVNCTFCPNCTGGPNCTSFKQDLCECNPCQDRSLSCIENKQGNGPRECVVPPDTAGSEFTLMFEHNIGDGGDTLEVYVSAASEDGQERTVTVDAPLIGHSESAVIAKGAVKRFTLPSSLMHKGIGKANVGIRVVETKGRFVNVYCMNRAAYSADGWLALPDKVAGRAFKVITYWPVTSAAQFALVATKNNTNVTINLVDGSPDITGSGRDTSIVVHLDAWQTYQVQSKYNDTDFTGSSIVSNNPIHVYSGEGRAWVAPNETYLYYQLAINKKQSRDILVLECPSIDTWGRTFALVPLPRTMIYYNSTEELVKLVGWTVTSCTIYSTNGSHANSVSFNLNATNSYRKRFYIDAAYNFFLSCDQAVMVVEITESAILKGPTQPGKDAPDEYNDPSFIYVPAVSSYVNYYYFNPPTFTAGNNRPYTWTYLRLIAKASEYLGIMINEGPLLNQTLETLKNWTRLYIPIGNPIEFPELFGCIVRISSSDLTFISHRSRNAAFAAIVEGFDDRESYGIVLGANIKPQNNSFSVAALQSGPVVATIL